MVSFIWTWMSFIMVTPSWAILQPLIMTNPIRIDQKNRLAIRLTCVPSISEMSDPVCPMGTEMSWSSKSAGALVLP